MTTVRGNDNDVAQTWLWWRSHSWIGYDDDLATELLFPEEDEKDEKHVTSRERKSRDSETGNWNSTCSGKYEFSNCKVYPRLIFVFFLFFLFCFVFFVCFFLFFVLKSVRCINESISIFCDRKSLSLQFVVFCSTMTWRRCHEVLQFPTSSSPILNDLL